MIWDLLPENVKNKIDRNAPGGCWEWSGCKVKGYAWAWYRNRNCKLHRIVAELSTGVDVTGKVVMHKCDNTSCVNPDHLSVGTQADNIADMIHKGRKANMAGEDSPKHILTESDVLLIRERRRVGETYVSISKDFPVAHRTIQAVCLGKCWKNVGGLTDAS
jgi:hypothetical protein